jgi:NADPH-dependent 2,4-dienoyl-CoA reductase/sulfur reductase-like enzyme
MNAIKTILNKKSKNFSIITYLSKNFGAKHSQIIIIGAGTGGLAVGNQLANQNIVEGKNITIFDKSLVHYYQPGWTKYGGGIIKNFDEVKHDVRHYVKRFNFENQGVTSINPETNTIISEDNQSWTYDQLIIAAGLEVKLDSIPGLKKLLEDDSKFVGTIYDPVYVQKVKRMRETFKGGRALFTQPPPPLKCGGAPQKIAYLCDYHWKNNNIKADVHFFTPLPQMFAVKYYSDSLAKIVKEKGITPHFTSVLTSVEDGLATFKNTTTNEIFQEKFDFLHAVPHMGTPKFLLGSPVSNPSGFVTIDRSMRHKKYNNIWALGDCTDLPNAKTAAAVFSQAPVLVHNLESVIKKSGEDLVIYDGYSSCPLFLSTDNLLLAEFKEYNDENGNLVRELDESFHPGQQNIPRPLYYRICHCFTKIYTLGMKGRWFGKNSLFKPTFKKDAFDIRKYYKLLSFLPPFKF